MSNCIPCQIGTTALPKSGIDCGIDNSQTGNCTLDGDGNPIVTPTASGGIPTPACTPLPNGTLCPVDVNCSPFDFSNQDTDSCIVNSVISESINISGAILNVYRLLGVHEQGLLVDQVGTGSPISSGDLPNFPAKNAFTVFDTEWRSIQIGADVLKSAYIGYDFGPIKLDNGRVRYGIETAIHKDVYRVAFKQGCDAINRVTQIRLERSNDGKKWYGVTLLDVPDCDGLVQLNFKTSVPSRYWRIRPLKFNGGVNDYWAVKAFQLIDYENTAITNIQDRIWLENRDRAYDKIPIKMKGIYTPVDVVSNLDKFGMWQGADTYTIEVSFTSALATLGRPFVIGDILELPSETQYMPNMTPVKKFFDVIDVAWSINGYTANYIPTLQRLLCKPAAASQETQNVYGKLTPDQDALGTVDRDNGFNTLYQDFSAISQTIKADANTAVPERGEDYSEIQKLSDSAINFGDMHPHMNLRKIDIRARRSPYGIDAMPPNGLPYTEGNAFPANPKNGDYHRLTYTHNDKNIETRLYRYSTAKLHWIYLETDHRYAVNNAKPVLQEFLDPRVSSVTPIDKINDNI